MAPGMSSFSATITSSTAPCVAAAPPHPRARHSLPQGARLQCKGSSSSSCCCCCSRSLCLSILQTPISSPAAFALHCIALYCIQFTRFFIGVFMLVDFLSGRKEEQDSIVGTSASQSVSQCFGWMGVFDSLVRL
jgi:hypothetical protein